MNILVLSSGTRNKIIQYLKKSIKNVKVVATDMSEAAPALYEADKYYIVPRISADDYLDNVIDICKKEKIDGVFSLIDPELNLLAKNEKKFEDVGVTILGSSFELCERSLNKYKMYEWLVKHRYNTAKTYVDKDLFYKDVENHLISYPVFVKPICGSASISITKVFDRETIEFLFSRSNDLMIQEMMDCQEIGTDVYVDIVSKKVVSIFTKKKIVMKAGETDKASSFKDPALFALVEKFVEESGFTAQIDIDIFEKNGEYYISEVNPRFGGGYPHAYECGCDFMKLIENNLNGIENKKDIGSYEENVVMMKYPEIAIRK